MKDLYCTIVFKRKDKVIWTLRCDKETFNKIEELTNFYLIREAYKK